MNAQVEMDPTPCSRGQRTWSMFKEDVNCVFKRDPAARNRFEVIVTYPGIQAIAIHRVSHKLWSRGWRFIPRCLSFFSRLFTNVDIHPGAKIGRRFFIDHGASVVIGETAIIGDDVTLYHGVTLGGTSWNKGRRHPQLGNHVMVGAGAKILGAIYVGSHSRIGANSVVVETVPDHCTVIGIPGKVVVTDADAKRSNHGINLDHHLIPDPVGKAIECLLERIDALELAIEAGNSISLQEQRAANCNVDNELCESQCSVGKIALEIKRDGDNNRHHAQAVGQFD